MKKLIVFSLSIIFSSALMAQMKVPAMVSKEFEKKFADATHIKWGKENATEYEADFELKGKKMSANFDVNGNWKETETEININELPQVVVQSVNEKYAGAKISGASEIKKSDGKIIYEADIKMNGKKKEVELFPDGKFVK